MSDDRCPWCGAGINRNDPETWDCGTQRLEVAVQTTQCVRHQLFDAQARVARLEAALKRIDTENPVIEDTDEWESKYASSNTGDVFDAGVTLGGVTAGNIAREALRADA